MKITIQIEHGGHFSKTMEEVERDHTISFAKAPTAELTVRQLAERVLERALAGWE